MIITKRRAAFCFCEQYVNLHVDENKALGFQEFLNLDRQLIYTNLEISNNNFKKQKISALTCRFKWYRKITVKVNIYY